MEPPTPRPELLEPSGTGSVPSMARGSVQYRWWEPASSLTQSASGSQNGPVSRATTDQPPRASRWASTPPPAPQPTIATSTSSLSAYRRMSRRSRWLVRVPSFGRSQADSLRSRTLTGRPPAAAGAPRRPAVPTGSGRAPALGPLPGLALVQADVLVPARVRRPAEADLVPRPGVRVEGRAGIAGPQAPHVTRRQPVPVRAVARPVLHGLDQRGLFRAGQRRQAPAVPVGRVGVEEGQCLPPRLPVGGHVGVVPAVRAALGQPLVDHGQHGHPRLVPLVEQVVEQRAGDRLLGRGEEPQGMRRSEPAQHDARRDVVPRGQLREHVIAVEPTLPARRDPGPAPHQRSRRSTAASRPIPPTIVTSSGANSGGPISALYRTSRHPPGRYAIPRTCR